MSVSAVFLYVLLLDLIATVWPQLSHFSNVQSVKLSWEVESHVSAPIHGGLIIKLAEEADMIVQCWLSVLCTEGQIGFKRTLFEDKRNRSDTQRGLKVIHIPHVIISTVGSVKNVVFKMWWGTFGNANMQKTAHSQRDGEDSCNITMQIKTLSDGLWNVIYWCASTDTNSPFFSWRTAQICVFQLEEQLFITAYNHDNL